MRATFYREKLTPGQLITIKDEQAHHLNVVRVKIDEEILVLNGLGQKARAQIISITKKEVVIKLITIEEDSKKHNLELAIANPKKDAFEDILKMAVELGVTNIYPLESKFSQYDYTSSDRIDRLIESALIQSNNLFWPNIFPQESLINFLNNNKHPIVYFSSQEVPAKINLNPDQKIIILIGPEAGFSNEETEQIKGLAGVNLIHLPTPILRAPTAVATSVGYLLSMIK